jgi:hypothetical protein
MTIAPKAPVQQLPTQAPIQCDPPTQKVDQVEQVTQSDPVQQKVEVKGSGTDTPVQQVPTAGSPQQSPAQTASKPSWFSTHFKLVGALAGGALGGGIGFLTLGLPGAIGGAAVGALGGWFLMDKFYHPKT